MSNARQDDPRAVTPGLEEYEISPAEAAERLATDDAADFILVDCREPDELATAAIPGAVHIPTGEIPARWHELDTGAEIAVICHHGQRSLNATMFLHKQGIDEARSVTGGIDAWSRLIDPSIPRY